MVRIAEYYADAAMPNISDSPQCGLFTSTCGFKQASTDQTGFHQEPKTSPGVQFGSSLSLPEWVPG